MRVSHVHVVSQGLLRYLVAVSLRPTSESRSPLGVYHIQRHCALREGRLWLSASRTSYPILQKSTLRDSFSSAGAAPWIWLGSTGLRCTYWTRPPCATAAAVSFRSSAVFTPLRKCCTRPRPTSTRLWPGSSTRRGWDWTWFLAGSWRWRRQLVSPWTRSISTVTTRAQQNSKRPSHWESVALWWIASNWTCSIELRLVPERPKTSSSECHQASIPTPTSTPPPALSTPSSAFPSRLVTLLVPFASLWPPRTLTYVGSISTWAPLSLSWSPIGRQRIWYSGFAAEFRGEGLELSEFSPGGGFAIAYTRDQHPPPIAEYASTIVNTLQSTCDELGLGRPTLLVEPGRSIISPAGVALYTIGTIKDIPGVRKYVSVDGGMGDNIRPALYQASYEVISAGKANADANETVTITGKYCESGDILASDVLLPASEPGDVIAIPASGAYCSSMSSNYNLNPRPPVVLVRDGKSRVIRRRKSYQDMMLCDV